MILYFHLPSHLTRPQAEERHWQEEGWIPRLCRLLGETCEEVLRNFCNALLRVLRSKFCRFKLSALLS